jgi:hypothetical protein
MTYVREFKFQKGEASETFDSLEPGEHLTRIKNALEGTPDNEACSRIRINELLLYAHEHVQQSLPRKSSLIHLQVEKPWSASS